MDDAVGECYDKVARVIGLSYPGGPLVDELAHKGNPTYKLPTPLDDDTYNFSFSGLKSAIINLVHNEEQRGNKLSIEDLATSFQKDVVDILAKKTMRALKEYNVNNLIICGGVAANRGIRDKFMTICKENNIDLFIDDSIKHCRNVQSGNIRTLLYTSICNQGVETPDLERAYSWVQIYDKYHKYFQK